MEDEIYFKRKENLVIKDFELAFKSYEKLVGNIAKIRQWTVTIMIGMIYFNSNNGHFEASVIMPVIICFTTFLILELRERSSKRFDKDEILNLEGIFMLKDNESYRKKIDEY